jgi:hypothetical protein
MFIQIAPAQSEPCRHTMDRPRDLSAPTCEAVPAPAAGTKRRGNPNLRLALRCGACTRAGGPCGAPAIRGKRRCRMHGGRSTGPRTADGMARLRAARTVHGAFSAETRASNRHALTMLRRGRVGNDAIRYADRLPPELALRLEQMPVELLPPARPSAGLTSAQDRAVLRVEAAALAPWQQAIVLARCPSRLVAPSPEAARAPQLIAMAEAHAPEGAASAALSHDAVDAAASNPTTEPHAPDTQTSAARPANAADAADAAAGHPTAEAHAPIPQAGTARPANAPGAMAANSAAAPHAPDMHAPDTHTTDVRSEDATDTVSANPTAEAHAPERGPGLRHTDPATPTSAPTTHAGAPQAATPPACLLGAAGVAAGTALATTKPHAPDSPAAAPHIRDTENCAAARRWHRQQRRLAHHVRR